MALKLTLKLLANLPLRWLHHIGVSLSWLAYLLSPKYSQQLKQNIILSNICDNQISSKKALKSNISETGKAILELPFIWFRPKKEVLSYISSISGVNELKKILGKKTGVIFITPHLGSFEIIPKYLAEYITITSLYRPPHKSYLAHAMLDGRTSDKQFVAPTNLSGVRQLFKALKNGEAVGILPDQVPKKGDGQWINFFGRPAYTMTLAHELAQRTQAEVIFTYSVRNPTSDGFDLFFEPLSSKERKNFNALLLNKKLERIIRKHPTQYLWAYNRHKGS